MLGIVNIKGSMESTRASMAKFMMLYLLLFVFEKYGC